MDSTMLSPEDVELPPSPPPELTEIQCMTNNLPCEKLKPKILQPRPETPRRSTDPTLSLDTHEGTTRFSGFITTSIPSRPRNHSPYSRSHYRSRSSAGTTMGAPPMARAHSSPGMDSNGRIHVPGSIRPSSPLGPPQGRRRSPLRTAIEDFHPSNYTLANRVVSQPIAEYSPLETTPRTSIIPEDSEAPSSPLLLPSMHNTFPRVRRRPSSPLHHVASAPSFSTMTTNNYAPSPVSSQASPIIGPSTKFVNEPYPMSSPAFPYSYSFSSSSMPSTPTSIRSRSPSISSLETIPDDTDAEEAAIAAEAERLAQLRSQAVEDGDDADGDNRREGRRRTSLDVPGRGGSANSKRKRWSVCGAERRGDLDLETIWED